MAEIEISVLNRQCLHNRYIPSLDALRKEVSDWQKQRNDVKAKIDWMFAVEDARNRMGHLYPKLLQAIADHVENQAIEAVAV